MYKVVETALALSLTQVSNAAALPPNPLNQGWEGGIPKILSVMFYWTDLE
jgi:hypothetical protein